jgi:hypothetical protein
MPSPLHPPSYEAPHARLLILLSTATCAAAERAHAPAAPRWRARVCWSQPRHCRRHHPHQQQLLLLRRHPPPLQWRPMPLRRCRQDGPAPLAGARATPCFPWPRYAQHTARECVRASMSACVGRSVQGRSAREAEIAGTAPSTRNIIARGCIHWTNFNQRHAVGSRQAPVTALHARHTPTFQPAPLHHCTDLCTAVCMQ